MQKLRFCRAGAKILSDHNNSWQAGRLTDIYEFQNNKKNRYVGFKTAKNRYVSFKTVKNRYMSFKTVEINMNNKKNNNNKNYNNTNNKNNR